MTKPASSIRAMAALNSRFSKKDNPSLAFTLAQRQEMGSSRHFSGDQPWSEGHFHRYLISSKKTGLWNRPRRSREPHSFDVRLSLGHRGHVHDYDVEFREHEHDHDHSSLEGLDVNSREYQDAHEKAHANDIKNVLRIAA